MPDVCFMISEENLKLICSCVLCAEASSFLRSTFWRVPPRGQSNVSRIIEKNDQWHRTQKISASKQKKNISECMNMII